MSTSLGIGLNITGAKKSSGVAPTPTAPVNIVAPYLVGDNYPTGELFIQRGSWTGYPSISFTYQWYSNSLVITGETDRTYVIREEDIGNTITARVTATNTEGSSFEDTDGVAIEEGPDAWLIASGVWNDDGIWDDSSNWNDGE